MPKSTPQASLLPAEVWRGLRHEWLWVYHGVVPHDSEWSAEITVPAGVFFVERGEVRIRADGREIIVTPGQAFFSAPGQRRQWFARRTRLLSAGFRSQWPDGTPLFRSGLNFAAKAPDLRRATLRLFREIHGAKKAVGYRDARQPGVQSLPGWAAHEAAFRAWFLPFIETMEALNVRPEARVGSSRRRVEQLTAWLSARPLRQTAPSLPPGFPLGLRRADQLLQQHLGLGLRAFLEQRRLEAARTHIVSGEGTLKETAFNLGFRHASHFTAWFRRHTGVSPSAFRAGGAEAA